MRNIQILTILLLLVSTTSMQAQVSKNVKGIVTDMNLGNPIPGAKVVIEEIQPVKATATDNAGRFKISDIKLSKITVKISCIGYKSITIPNINLLSAKEKYLEIKLEEKITELEELVISGTNKAKSINESAFVSARSFTVEETQRYAGTLSDPSRMAANFAGVSSISDNRNDIIIRGNSPTGLLWRLEGIDIPNPNHFGIMGTTGGPVCILNNNVLANSDFITGAFPSEYGNSTSGVFDLKLRNGNYENREHTIQLGYSGLEIGTEGPLSKKSKASYLFNMRYSQIGLMDDIGIASEDIPAIPKYKDISYKINFPLKKGKLSFWGIGGISDINYIESEKDSTERMYLSYARDSYLSALMWVAGLTHTHYFNINTRIKTNIAFSQIKSANKLDSVNLTDAASTIIRGYESTENKYSLNSNLKHRFNKKNFFKGGININVFDVCLNDSISISAGNYKILNNCSDYLSLIELYAEYKHKFSDKAHLITGLHSQFLTLNSDWSIEPRIAFKYAFSARQTISISYGLHSQMHPRTIYLLESDVNNEKLMTNKNLGFTKSNHFIVSYDFLITQNLRIKLEPYLQLLTNVPVSETEQGFSMLNIGADFEIPLKENLKNKGTGQNYGAELTVEHFFSKNFYFLTTLSLFNSKYTDFNGIRRNTEFNGNFVYNLLAGYEFKLWKNSKLSFNAKTVWAGGKRYVPVLTEESVNAGYVIYDWDNAYAKKRGDFFRLDFNIRLKINRKKVSHEIGIEMQNITDHKNIFTEYFDVHSGTYKKEYQVGFYMMPTYKLYF